MDPSAITTILKLLSHYFQEESIPYVIVGGISVLTWGRTRSTEDIDVIVDHTRLNIDHFVKYLQEKGFFAEVEDFAGFKERSHCTIIKKDSLNINSTKETKNGNIALYIVSDGSIDFKKSLNDLSSMVSGSGCIR